MKIIFLDIDGVLNSSFDVKEEYERTGIKKGLINTVYERPILLLKTLIDETEAKIVLSSSWRLFSEDTPDEISLLSILKEELNKYGLGIYDITPNLQSENNCRGKEIKKWIANNQNKEIESFVILDDDSDMEDLKETNLVQTTFKDGLQIHHIEKALNILQKR